MDYTVPNCTKRNIRYNIICPEPIKVSSVRIMPETRQAHHYDEYDCEVDQFASCPEQTSANFCIQNYMYSRDPDMEAQEELLMIVTSPKSTTPVPEPIERTHFVPTNNDFLTLSMMRGGFAGRRRRSQSLNDSYLISAF